MYSPSLEGLFFAGYFLRFWEANRRNILLPVVFVLDDAKGYSGFRLNINID